MAENTVEFRGSGRDVLELMKKAICDFKEVYLTNAFLHPHHGYPEVGRAILEILIYIPEEKKWIEIRYNHHEGAGEDEGSGSISYRKYYYHRESFPKERIERSKSASYTWGYTMLNGEDLLRYVLDEYLERKKCMH